MKQGRLTFWKSDDFITYSELQDCRAQEYEKRVPALLRDCAEALELFDLATLNDASTELAALNPAWSEFSLTVFQACLSPTQNSPKLIREAFELTLKRLLPKEMQVAA